MAIVVQHLLRDTDSLLGLECRFNQGPATIIHRLRQFTKSTD
jgi:hypothetical protein